MLEHCSLQGGLQPEMIYFFKNRDYIKIGFTDNPARREETHRTTEGLEPIAYMKGDRDFEAKLLDHFGQYRLEGRGKDRFQRVDVIFEYVEKLLTTGYAAADYEAAEMLPEMPYFVVGPGYLNTTATEASGQRTFLSLLPVEERIAWKAACAENHSMSDEWYTPEEWISRARQVMGKIDTDPATSGLVNGKFIKARIFYTKETNGLDLARPWTGNVWLNPPYGRGENSAGAFLKRLEREWKQGNIIQAITCLNVASISAMWFFSVMPEIAALHCVAHGRPNFIPPDGRTNNSSPNKGTVFSYIGPNQNQFAAVFGEYGQILQPYCLATSNVRQQDSVVTY